MGDKIPYTSNLAKMLYQEVVETFVGPSTKSKEFFCNKKQIRDEEKKTLTGNEELISAGTPAATLKDNKEMKKNAGKIFFGN